MKRIVVPIVAAMLAISLASCGTPAANPAPGPTGTALSIDKLAIAKYGKQIRGIPEKDFTLKDLNGKEWKLSDLKGKIVLLNFWATWCNPCQQEMPDFQKLHDRFGDDGAVVVLAVASGALEDGSGEAQLHAVKVFADDRHYTFPMLFDADGSVWSMYEQQGIPSNYIIDAEGSIRLIKVGAFGGEDDIYAALEAVRRADSGQ